MNHFSEDAAEERLDKTKSVRGFVFAIMFV